ncbi:unnamed protein product, partial [Mesorhabditis spiculigera]
MPSQTQICKWIIAGQNITPELLSMHPDNPDIGNLNRITYAYIAPAIIFVGIIGDILTVVTLTHPALRKSSIIYTYLTLLAMTDLLTQLSVVPMILWLLDVKACSLGSALFYAHIGFPLANALMGASVWIVVFLTLSQYMAVCRPFSYGLRSRKVCILLFALAYLFNFCIYAPWATKKQIHELDNYEAVNLCRWQVCDNHKQQWFVAYEWVRETISRVFPFFLVAFLNARILITYRNMKVDRLKRMANSQKRFVYEKTAPLTVLVADNKSNNVKFQIFRAVVNLLEFTKFALNFYFYCLINPDIRRICAHVIMCRKLSRPARVKGQPVTPLSQYTRSTKSTIRNGSSRRSSSRDDVREYRRNSSAKQRQVIQAEALIEKLTVIKEAENSETENGGERV